MAYDYSSDSKLLELPNPYQLQNRLLWACAALLIVAGLVALWWAREAMQAHALRMAGAPLLVGVAMLAAGIVCAATAARRLRFFFGRGRPASLAPEIPVGATGTSPAADQVKDILRHGSLTYPEPKGAIEGMLYHWVPTLITAPQQVQVLARRYAFNLAAFAATLLSFLFSWLLFGTDTTRAWIGILYFLFGAFFLVRPVLQQGQARLTVASLIGLIAAAILAPVLIGLVGPNLPSLRGFSLNTQTFVMLGTALLACSLAMAAVLAQVDTAPQTRASVEQARVAMNAPPGTLLDELDRTLQNEWTERIPNRRYARAEPKTPASTPSGSFTGELFEETQPLPVPGTKAPGFSAALADRRHLPLLLLDLYAVVLVVLAVGMALLFVRGFDPLSAWSENRISLAGNAAILALVAAFCFQSSARLWGRFNFHSVLVWVEMAGAYQTSRIGTGNNFSSRMNTENDVVRTEAMTLRVWRARIESVVFGKDEARQVTAMFSTEKEARSLASHLIDFARSQSVLVAPMSREDQARIDMLNSGEGALRGPSAPAMQQLAGGAAPPAIDLDVGVQPLHCSRCGAPSQPGAKFCSRCGAALVA
jgi:hypothetical protein